MNEEQKVYLRDGKATFFLYDDSVPPRVIEMIEIDLSDIDQPIKRFAPQG